MNIGKIKQNQCQLSVAFVFHRFNYILISDNYHADSNSVKKIDSVKPLVFKLILDNQLGDQLYSSISASITGLICFVGFFYKTGGGYNRSAGGLAMEESLLSSVLPLV